MNEFLRIWVTAIIRPQRAFSALAEKPAPSWGLYSTLLRFVGTAMTSILALYLLDRRPFVSSYLTFLDKDSYYGAEILFLPVFGVAVWLLSSSLVHLIISYTKVSGNIDWVMNVIGFSLLVVMPVVWLVDWVAIALDIYGASITIPFHAAVSFWEVGLMAVGFKRLEGMGWRFSVALGVLVKAGVYIPLAALFVR